MKSVFYFKSSHAIELIAAIMVMLFAYTGLSKLIGHSIFYGQLKASPYIGLYAPWLSWLITITEFTIVALLLLRRTHLAGYYAFTLLMILFTIYIAGLLAGNRELPCSCGSIIQQISSKQHLFVNSCLILSGIAAIMLHTGSRKQ